MHGTDALPLPPHPDIEQYGKLAQELAGAVKSGDAEVIQAFARRWIGRLRRRSGEDEHPRYADALANDARRFTRYWTGEHKPKDMPPPQATLAHAQFVIARVHGFRSWEELLRHLDQLARRDSGVARFEAAVDAIVGGDSDALRRLLREDPELVRARSGRSHGCTLLHYVSANGVEGYRQKTPPNIVAITRLLLESGSDVNATAQCYGGGDTPLGLTSTSVHPHDAGVMIPMLETLVDAGANVNSRDGGWGAIRSCLANGQPEAAAWLAEHGAEVNLADAAGIGWLDRVRTFLSPDGKLSNGASEAQLEEGFKNASWYGRFDVIRYLLDAGFAVDRRFEDGATGLHHAAYDGNAAVVELLLARGAPVGVREAEHHGTPLDWALWAWGVDRRGRKDATKYYRVVAMLINAGAPLDRPWYDSEGGRRVFAVVETDPQMQAALRGEVPS
jgi:ankyrin repeat protein